VNYYGMVVKYAGILTIKSGFKITAVIYCGIVL